jgi:hypothetical protein
MPRRTVYLGHGAGSDAAQDRLAKRRVELFTLVTTQARMPRRIAWRNTAWNCLPWSRRRLGCRAGSPREMPRRTVYLGRGAGSDAAKDRLAKCFKECGRLPQLGVPAEAECLQKQRRHGNKNSVKKRKIIKLSRSLLG